MYSKSFHRNSLSAVNPDTYAQRMVNFILAHTDYDEILDERRRRMNLPSTSNGAIDAAATAGKEGKRGVKLSTIFSFGKSKKKKGGGPAAAPPAVTASAAAGRAAPTGDAKVDML